MALATFEPPISSINQKVYLATQRLVNDAEKDSAREQVRHSFL
jgi:hypothetical protein